MRDEYIKVLSLLYIMFVCEMAFGSDPYGLITTPLSLHDNTVSGGIYSNQGTIDSLDDEGSAGGVYSNSIIMDMSKPYMVCSHTVTPADYDGNSIVDLADLSVFARHWLEGDCLPWNAWCGDTDLNNDNVVDINDLIELASSWLQ